jgi:hypothetical protein
MPQSIWIFIPALWMPSCFDFLVLVAGIVLLWNRDKSGIDDLTAASLQALRTQVSLEHLEEFLDDLRLSQSLSEEGDRGCIRNAVHYAKHDKLFEGAPVIDLKSNLFIAEIEQLLKDQHLEEDQRINPLSPRVALPVLRVGFLK